MISDKEQIINQFWRAKNILLLTKQSYHGDDIACLLAWHSFLKLKQKNHDVLIADYQPQNNWRFLPGTDVIQSSFSRLKKFTIAVNLKQSKLENFSYDQKDDQLLIYLTPEKGFIEYEDISFRNTDFKYDLVICLGVPDYHSLGRIYEEQADFFYQVPVINIDYHHLNEYFGDINHIDVTANSLAEISYDLFEQLGPESINQDVATCLLTGLIQATRSFRAPNVTPQTLHLASQLIKLGADRKYIVEKLFQTKSLATLKLWGRVLSQLKNDNDYKIVWTEVKKQDLTELNVSEEDLASIIDELIITSPQAEIVLIFLSLDNNTTKVYLYSSRGYDSLQLTNKFTPHGDKDLVWFTLQLPLDQAMPTTIDTVREKIKNLIP